MAKLALGKAQVNAEVALANAERDRLKEELARVTGGKPPAPVENLDTAIKPRKGKTLEVAFQYKMSLPQQKFADLIRSGRKICLLSGSVKVGKTFAGAREAFKQIYKYWTPDKPNLGWIVAPTHKMLATACEEFEQVAGPTILKKLRAERSYLMLPPKGCRLPFFRVDCRSAELPDNLRGPNVAFVWGDESSMYDREAHAIILSRMVGSKGQVLYTTTPRGFNWLWEDVARRAQDGDPEIGVVFGQLRDNFTLDVRSIELLERMYAGMPDFARQELYGEFVNFSGLVYRQFTQAQHVIDPIAVDKDEYVCAGVDFGYGDPTVHLWGVKRGKRWIIFDEHYQSKGTMRDHAMEIKSHEKSTFTVSRRWADNGGGGAQCIADLATFGIDCVPAREAKKNIEAGLFEVARLLSEKLDDGKPALQITRNCRHTLTEFGQYSYDSGSDSEQKKNLRRPRDFHNHCMDALRYLLHSEMGSNRRLAAVNFDDAGRALIDPDASLERPEETRIYKPGIPLWGEPDLAEAGEMEY